MTTDINNNLTQFCGKTGLEYQITVRSKNNSPVMFEWITLTEEQMNNLVIDYIKFKLKKE